MRFRTAGTNVSIVKYWVTKTSKNLKCFSQDYTRFKLVRDSIQLSKLIQALTIGSTAIGNSLLHFQARPAAPARQPYRYVIIKHCCDCQACGKEI